MPCIQKAIFEFLNQVDGFPKKNKRKVEKAERAKSPRV